jgi:hypothetical protein
VHGNLLKPLRVKVILLRQGRVEVVCVTYGKSVSTEEWKWFSLDVEIIENPEE